MSIALTQALFFLLLSSRGQAYPGNHLEQFVVSSCFRDGVLSGKWISAETDTDWAQKSQVRNIKEKLTFGTFRPIVLVVGGRRCPKKGRVASSHPQE